MKSQLGLPELHAAMGQCRWHFISVAVFSIFVNLLMLTGPLFMLQIYDRVLTSRSEATLVALLVLITGLFGMMGLLEFVRGRVLARAGARFQTLLDSRVMTAVLRRAVQPDERARPNTAARDLEAVRQLLSGPAPFALFDMPWAPIFIGVIFIFHPFLGWIAVFSAIILVILTLVNQLRSREPSGDSQRATAEADNLGEAMRQNAEAMQGMGMRDVGMARWLKLRQEALSRQIVASDRTASYTSSSKALRFYLQSVMLAAGAWLVLQQEVSAGMMIAASIMLGRALAPVEQAIGQWGLAQRAARGWKSLVEVLEKTPPEIEKTALPVPKGYIDVQGVTVMAPGESYPVLRAISFQVQPGTAIGVIGPSGAGKTTLAKVLTGIWRPAAGKVRIDGAALDQWPEDTLGKHLGYLPQEIGLMSGTVAENIARLSEQRDDKAVVEAAQRAGAHELLLTLPQGYDTQIGAGGQRLSGGQRQRVALARALYGDPPVLILDEPNANLDAPGEQALVDAIRDAKTRGKTVIVMAHRPSAIAACDLLLMIDKGVQIDFGPRDEVLKKRTKNYAQLQGVAQAAQQSTGLMLNTASAPGKAPAPVKAAASGRAPASAAAPVAAPVAPQATAIPGLLQRHNVRAGSIGTVTPAAARARDDAKRKDSASPHEAALDSPPDSAEPAPPTAKAGDGPSTGSAPSGNPKWMDRTPAEPVNSPADSGAVAEPERATTASESDPSANSPASSMAGKSDGAASTGGGPVEPTRTATGMNDFEQVQPAPDTSGDSPSAEPTRTGNGASGGDSAAAPPKRTEAASEPVGTKSETRPESAGNGPDEPAPEKPRKRFFSVFDPPEDEPGSDARAATRPRAKPADKHKPAAGDKP